MLIVNTYFVFISFVCIFIVSDLRFIFGRSLILSFYNAYFDAVQCSTFTLQLYWMWCLLFCVWRESKSNHGNLNFVSKPNWIKLNETEYLCSKTPCKHSHSWCARISFSGEIKHFRHATIDLFVLLVHIEVERGDCVDWLKKSEVK